MFFSLSLSAFALKCYTCTGTEDICSKSKLEGNNDKYLKTCPSGLDRCFRTWVHKYGNTAVTNDCTNQSGCDLAQNVCDKVDDVDCTVGCCGSDACNAGTTEKGTYFATCVLNMQTKIVDIYSRMP